MPQHTMPRYRGFNLLDLFSTSNRWDEFFPMSHGAFVENDLKWMSEWGFNFARIPMSYLYFVANGDRTVFLESQLENLDNLIEMGKKYGVHISLNFHRAAGYCVNGYPFDIPAVGDLWSQREELELFKLHWGILAKRYKGISSDLLSFNLLNEPPLLTDGIMAGKVTPEMKAITTEAFVRVNQEATDAIHAIDPGRLVIADGPDGTITPCAQLKDAAQACRGYFPLFVSHYNCPWMDFSAFAPSGLVPSWPTPESAGEIGGNAMLEEVLDAMGLTGGWNKDKLREFYKPWFDAADKGLPVVMGECGCYNKTPHKVMLAWLDDLLSLMKEQNIGYAMWNFRGPFGVLDTGRTDIVAEDWHGHALDRELLTLLQKY